LDLEQWWPIPAFLPLWRTSQRIFSAYNTRARKNTLVKDEKKTARSAPAAPDAPRDQKLPL